MKTIFTAGWRAGWLVTAMMVAGWSAGTTGLLGATNDLASALQRGLFEEEANQNLPAAIAAYEGVIRQFDQDRRLAATAVFRLGECYRKQGKTNEAAAQYERITREFADQGTLVGMSEQHLAAWRGTGEAGAKSTGEAVLRERALTLEEEAEVRRIQGIIKDSPDLINARDGEGWTPLHNAAAKGQLIVARFLLDSGAEVNARTRGGDSALHRAAEGGHKSMVELLLDRKAEVAAAGTLGRTALHVAAGNGFKSVVEVLLARGADPNSKNTAGETPLHVAAAKDRRAVVETLLGAGASVNARDGRGRTPLHHAASARAGNDLLEVLLGKGAEVNARDTEGTTALVEAWAAKNPPGLELLLRHKADPNLGFDRVEGSEKKRSTYYLLYEVVSQKDAQLTEKLLAHGADPNVVSGPSAWTPLALSCGNHGETNIPALLLQYKADPNIASKWIGATPLHTSLAQEPLRRLLLKAGANVNATNHAGETPLHWAVGADLAPAVGDLIKGGAKVDVRDAAGQTPLHWAVALGPKELVDLLLEAGSDPNVVDNTGRTPWDVAVNPVSQGYMVQNLGPGLSVRLRTPTPGAFGGSYPPGSGLPGLSVPGRRPVGLGSGTVALSPIAESLKKFGAMADVPRRDQVQFRRPNGGNTTVFKRGKETYNRFTLLETIASAYDVLGTDPAAGTQAGFSMGAYASARPGLGFPDFSRVRILEPGTNRTDWQERVVDLRGVTEEGQCERDVILDWGAIVELPETDHVLNERWRGFTPVQATNLVKCLGRRVEVVVKGKGTWIRLEPGIELVDQSIKPETPFWIKPVLLNSGLLLASSDLARVKVVRRGLKDGKGEAGEAQEFGVDCSEGKPAPEFWLRDGDRIEVPDK